MKQTASHDITADVPPVSMPQIHRNMPTRAPRTSATTTPRNLTGVYLGLEKAQNVYPNTIPRQSVPPFMKGQGFWKRVRTPTEERRHINTNPAVIYNDVSGCCFPLDPPSIPHLPNLPPTRYSLIAPQQKVELLRDREERRGFSGKPPKRKMRTPESTMWKDTQTLSSKMQEIDADVLDLTRQTNRYFTAVNNHGVLRLEYLNQPVYDNTATTYTNEGKQVPVIETVKNEVNRLALDRTDLMGIEECYKKVCKGNIEALQRLLPQRKTVENKRDNALRYTGFSVKSYRNPAQAEIIAHFPDPRPHTTCTHQSRYPITSPYFFKVYSQPKTASALSKSGNSYQEDQSATQTALARNSTPVFVGAASNLKGKLCAGFGPGSTSATLGAGVSTYAGLHELASPFVSPRRDLPPTSPRSPSLKPGNGDHNSTTSEYNKVEIAVPHPPPPEASHQVAVADEEVNPENHSQSNTKIKDLQESNDLANQDTEQPDPASGTEDLGTAMMPKEEGAKSSGAVILIGVEDESGEQLPVEIDEVDDILQKEKSEKIVDESPEEGPGPIQARKKSITERVNKSRESEKALNELREKAECRQQELASLLNEHAQIVKEIDYESDEKNCTEDNKENSQVPANSAT